MGGIDKIKRFLDRQSFHSRKLFRIKKYDTIISLGMCCEISLSLRDLGLRKESLPLDFAVSYKNKEIPEIIRNKFKSLKNYVKIQGFTGTPCGAPCGAPCAVLSRRDRSNGMRQNLQFLASRALELACSCHLPCCTAVSAHSIPHEGIQKSVPGQGLIAAVEAIPFLVRKIKKRNDAQQIKGPMGPEDSFFL